MIKVIDQTGSLFLTLGGGGLQFREVGEMQLMAAYAGSLNVYL